MFLLRKPSEEMIQSFLATQLGQTFSYHEIGASRGVAPTGYTVDIIALDLAKEWKYSREQ